MVLTNGGDPIESITLQPGPDPTLDAKLALSRQHPSMGSAVVVTATLRTLGREPASGMSVKFYAGTTVTGTLIATANLPGTLTFNESRPVVLNVVSSGTAQLLSARVIKTGEDTDMNNNVASAELGELPPPMNPTIIASSRYIGALDLAWLPPEVPGVAGYRILRSETAGGPYELVGEAMGAAYTDLLPRSDQTYYYVVEAYDTNGVLSVYSAEASRVILPYQVFIPVTMKSG